jgi:NADH-quinone oxidoreductase subunit J
MSFLGAIFYGLGALVLASTGLAVTRRNPVHAVLYLVVSLLGTALLYLLLGAPLPAILQVVVYAGAIMVLFLFVIMLLGLGAGRGGIALSRLILPGLLGAVALAGLGLVISRDPGAMAELTPAMADPAVLGHFLIDKYWPALEALSVLLFAALVGALWLGRPGCKTVPENRT